MGFSSSSVWGWYTGMEFTPEGVCQQLAIRHTPHVRKALIKKAKGIRHPTYQRLGGCGFCLRRLALGC